MQELLSNNISDIRKSLNSKRTSLPDSDKALSEAILNKEFVFVSDGSFIQSLQYGTAGWIAENKNNISDIHLAKGSAVTPGPAHIQCSLLSYSLI